MRGDGGGLGRRRQSSISHVDLPPPTAAVRQRGLSLTRRNTQSHSTRTLPRDSSEGLNATAAVAAWSKPGSIEFTAKSSGSKNRAAIYRAGEEMEAALIGCNKIAGKKISNARPIPHPLSRNESRNPLSNIVTKQSSGNTGLETYAAVSPTLTPQKAPLSPFFTLSYPMNEFQSDGGRHSHGQRITLNISG